MIDRAAFAGDGGDEVRVGLLVGTVQADDEVIGMRGVHDVCFCGGLPQGLTRRRQYRKVVM